MSKAAMIKKCCMKQQMSEIWKIQVLDIVSRNIRELITPKEGFL
jgi:hypothetical protein